MESKNPKYPEYTIHQLAETLAMQNQQSADYLSGPKMVSLFQSFGFKDFYENPGRGIVTPDNDRVSRRTYALKRLSDLNNRSLIPDFIKTYLQIENPSAAINKQIADILVKSGSSLVMKYLPDCIDQSDYKINLASPSPDNTFNSHGAEWTSVETNCNEDSLAIINSNIDEEFDRIPKDVRVVFISYSWDSPEHKAWVRKFAEKLAEYGIHVLMDEYIKGGFPLNLFMTKGINRADKVIVIGTQKYKQKSEESSSGAAFEGFVISSQLLDNLASTKFVPVLRKGTFHNSFPSLISPRKGCDMTDDSEFEKNIEQIVRYIQDMPDCQRPPLGNKTVKTDAHSNDSSLNTKDWNKDEIFKLNIDKKWLMQLLENFSFSLMHEYLTNEPSSIDHRVVHSFDMWTCIIENPTFRIYDEHLNSLIQVFYSKWRMIIELGLPYYCTVSPQRAAFTALQHDYFTTPEAEKAFLEIVSIQLEMQPLLKQLAEYVMDTYQIDVDSTSNKFLELL